MTGEVNHAQRLPVEIYFADELAALRANDKWPRPPGWQLSPRCVEAFVCGDEALGASPKFVAPRETVTRVIVSLATQRGVMLVGEPGTAKSWLSELLCAAISDNSTLVVQGGAIETLQQLLYSWNAAVIERKGPCTEALIPGPIFRGMKEGMLVRYEELARSSPALQDALLSIMSERCIPIPELEDTILYAREGFNLIGTSNTSDQGVNDISFALKRRMNFETLLPIDNIDDEIEVVRREAGKLLLASGVRLEPDESLLRVLVTIFHELRNGRTLDGRSTDRLASAVMSTAEAVSVVHAMGVHACYYGDGALHAEDVFNFLIGAAIKDNPTDLRRLDHYFETEIAGREGEHWATIYRCWAD